MQERLKAMEISALNAIADAGTAAVLHAARQQYLGKKGELTLVLKELGRLEEEERRVTGRLANEIKESISRLKTIIESKKGEQTDGQQTAEN